MLGMTTVESLRAEFEASGEDLAALIASLPPHVEEHLEPHENGVGMQLGPHRGWTDEEREQVAALRARRQQQALELARTRAEAAAEPAAAT